MSLTSVSLFICHPALVTVRVWVLEWRRHFLLSRSVRLCFSVIKKSHSATLWFFYKYRTHWSQERNRICFIKCLQLCNRRSDFYSMWIFSMQTKSLCGWHLTSINKHEITLSFNFFFCPLIPIYTVTFTYKVMRFHSCILVLKVRSHLLLFS